MRLTVETGPLAGTVVSLDRDHPTYLGSAADCGLRIQEAGVQPQHAVVKALKDQGFGMKVLAPGVRVNGTAVEATPLQDGDIIEIGTTRIAFGQVQKRGLPQIAGYRILGELGKGGMGLVYRAEQTSLHREVALKVLSRELTKDPAFVARFVAEARAAAKLQHPNVVQVFDVDNDGETYFYAMEVMHDGSLEGWLKQHGAMPVDRALTVVADAARGLAYAESLGIVHRDIKPDNLMLDQHGAVKIADLGLASTVEQTEEKAIGTPHFMAPEQVLNKDIDHRTDLYSLGCTFYRLVTGKTPFRGSSVKDILRAQVKDDAEPASKINPEVPTEVAAIIQKLMQKDPGQRYQTANALLEDIEVLLQPPAKKGLWIGLAAAAVLVAGGAIYWAVTKPAEKEYVEKRYDDPEKQQFADEIKRLQREQQQDRATIALLQVRLRGLGGTELATALERTASEHPGTEAAGEATRLAEQVRSEADSAARRTAQLASRRAEHLAAVQKAIEAPLQAQNFAAARKAAELAPPAELAGDAELAAAVQKLGDETLVAARAHLAALQRQVDDAVRAGDEAAITKAAEAYATAIADQQRWPPALAAELTQAATQVKAARSAIGELAASRSQAIWQQYHALFTPTAALRTSVERLDFAAAAAAAQAFVTTAGECAAAAHAKGLVAALQQAQAFGVAFDAALGNGALQLAMEQGPTLQLVRWDRAAAQLVAVDPQKKPAKEQVLPAGDLSIERWQALAEQVASPPPGSRECWLGFLSMVRHTGAAKSYLTRVTANDDQSGTGTGAYPLRASTFDQLLRRLPEQDQQPWVQAMRTELQAGQRLAAGMRAMSERRNLAAAAHLDKLLAEHPHSFVVVTLP
ncbi:MAG: protein kinase [Planctomycetes bacterium]|nr:protein kinase [Planctomycetota bacterium]